MNHLPALAINWHKEDETFLSSTSREVHFRTLGAKAKRPGVYVLRQCMHARGFGATLYLREVPLRFLCKDSPLHRES